MDLAQKSIGEKMDNVENLTTFEKSDEDGSKESYNWRSRKMLMILYPDDTTHMEALEIIKSNGYQYCGILHDKDSDENGELKKEHYHIYMTFKNARYVQGVADELHIASNYIRKCNDEKASLQYMVHVNQPEKYQYDASEVFGTLSSKFNEVLKADESEGLLICEFLDWLESCDFYVGVSAGCRQAAFMGIYSVFRRNASLMIKAIQEHDRSIKIERR